MSLASTEPLPAAAVPRPPEPRRILVKRHSLIVRLTHWTNALSLLFLLLSGLQIFNAHPSLYFGQQSSFNHPWLHMGAYQAQDGLHGVTQVGPYAFDTTSLFGASQTHGVWSSRGFPAWLTIPSVRFLALGRRWHFFFAWLFALNGALYIASAVLSGHLRRDLAPTASQLAPRHILADIWNHMRLRFPKGEDARHYNVLQKGAYLGVVLVLLPLMILTGMTMSPTLDTAFPWLLDLFGGRQSARSIHFIVASLIVLFFVVHMIMVVLAGPLNEIRSMITGRYAIDVEPPPTSAGGAP